MYPLPQSPTTQQINLPGPNFPFIQPSCSSMSCGRRDTTAAGYLNHFFTSARDRMLAWRRTGTFCDNVIIQYRSRKLQAVAPLGEFTELHQIQDAQACPACDMSEISAAVQLTLSINSSCLWSVNDDDVFDTSVVVIVVDAVYAALIVGITAGLFGGANA
ncbi:hypothetical protein RRG08_016563 [Elysia crispata]|uniref:Uncharacterized protein n=1 Tax=Elysia crispata TaxID=231223 RepID=A0AAE1AS57_9GAST|nr:hypothetical protein RRG08_016563 [Elysia crispata]